jgi:hypothetical protein
MFLGMLLVEFLKPLVLWNVYEHKALKSFDLV